MKKHITQLQPRVELEDSNENDVEQIAIRNPWQTGVYQQLMGEGMPSEIEDSSSQPQLRKSTKNTKTKS